jgi:hypothetical protein
MADHMYLVTIATSVGRRENHIDAKNRAEARKRVALYNKRHPTWKMRLLKRKAVS